MCKDFCVLLFIAWSTNLLLMLSWSKLGYPKRKRTAFMSHHSTQTLHHIQLEPKQSTQSHFFTQLLPLQPLQVSHRKKTPIATVIILSQWLYPHTCGTHTCRAFAMYCTHSDSVDVTIRGRTKSSPNDTKRKLEPKQVRFLLCFYSVFTIQVSNCPCFFYGR